MAQYSQDSSQIILPPLQVSLPALTSTQLILGQRVPYACTVFADAISFVPAVSVTANDTAYWTLVLSYLKVDGSSVTIATITTKTISGGGLGSLVAGTPVTIDSSQVNVPDGAIFSVLPTETGSATDPLGSFYIPIS